MDEDGQFTYSNVINLMINQSKSTWATVYPNPATDVLNIEVNMLKNENSIIQIVDMLGNILINTPIMFEKGFNTIPMNINALSKGNYFIKIKMDQEIAVQKFTKD